jgi:hypothetical protein
VEPGKQYGKSARQWNVDAVALLASAQESGHASSYTNFYFSTDPFTISKRKDQVIQAFYVNWSEKQTYSHAVAKKRNQERARAELAHETQRLVPDTRTGHGAHEPLRNRLELPWHCLLLSGAGGWRRHSEHQAAVDADHTGAFLVARQQLAALAWRATTGGQEQQAQGKDRRP